MEVTTVLGAKEIKENLKAAGVQFAFKIRKGLIRGGLLVQRLSQKVVPVDTGALRGSAGTRAFGVGWGTEVAVFYTQGYAVYVHERTELRHKKGKQAKYLEEPVRTHRAEILNSIAEGAR